MPESFLSYEFTLKRSDKGWSYIIYYPRSYKTIKRKSSEWFESEGEAKLAAIGHISLLEKEQKK